MIRKFLEGMVFGTGFALAFIVIIWLGFSFFVSRSESPSKISLSPLPAVTLGGAERPFHELPLEEQIKKASVIALVRYEKADDGKNKAIIKEFLKKDEGTTIYYNFGDEYPEGSFYPTEGRGQGDGMIIFFVGSPATMRMSVTYTGDRIHALGDLPMELFKKKCEKPNA